MDIRRRYQFKRGGFIFIAVTLLVSLGAFNSQNNLLFWAFGVGLSLLIVSGIVSGSMLMGVRVEREQIAPTTAGEQIAVRYTIKNTSKWMPAFALTIREQQHTQDIHNNKRKHSSKQTSKRSTLFANARQRKNSAAVNQPRILGPILAFIPYVPHDKTLQARTGAVTHRRGPARLDNIEISSSFPFGIFGKIVIFSQPATALVHPAQIELPRDLVRQIRGQSTRSTAASSSRRPGAGGPFHALRAFTPGDPLRAISWRASAKRDELIVRQDESPQPRRILLIPRLDRWQPQPDQPDTATIQPNQDPFERIIAVTASLARVLGEASTEVGLSIPTHGIEIAPAIGLRTHHAILDALASLEPQPANNQPTPFSKATNTIAVVEITTATRQGESDLQPIPGAVAVRADRIGPTAAQNQPARRKQDTADASNRTKKRAQGPTRGGAAV